MRQETKTDIPAQPMPSMKKTSWPVAPLAGVAEDVFQQARRLDTNDVIAMEMLSQLKASDVAGVRGIDNGGGLDSVGVMSSEVGIQRREE